MNGHHPLWWVQNPAYRSFSYFFCVRFAHGASMALGFDKLSKHDDEPPRETEGAFLFLVCGQFERGQECFFVIVQISDRILQV